MIRKTVRQLFGAACLLVAYLLVAPLPFAHGAELNLKSGVFDPPHMAPDFRLPGSTGSEVSLQAYRGKVIALGFGFTHCPNVCPMTLAKLTQVRKNLGAQADDLQVIYLTVDPDRDTAERLREYLGNFDRSFIGVTGTAEQLTAVRQAYGVVANKAAAGDGSANYTVHHSTSIYLVDRTGHLQAMVPFGKTTDDIAHDIGVLLRQ